MIIPPFLQKNDKVAVIAPAGKVQVELSPAIDLLRSWGLEVVLGKYLYQGSGVFAGTDEQRLQDLQWALDDPSIRAALIARGGYGVTRVIDRLDFTKFRQSPKWVAGFSDMTALLHRVNNLGIAAIHATMPVLMAIEDTGEADSSLQRAIFGEKLSYDIMPHPLNLPGMAEGDMIGGNLSMICNSIGTSSEINTDGKILFLEEVGEYAYHIDRMMVQLVRAGKLKRLKGMVIGHFSEIKEGQSPFGRDAYEIIRQYIDEMNFPVCFGFPSGHQPENLALYCGIRTKLEVKADAVHLSFHH